jgi:hypothetical protein
VPTFGKEMNLCRDARIIESPRIDRAVADFVNRVIPCLQQKRRWRLLCDVYAWVQRWARPTTPAMSGAPFGQMGTCSNPEGGCHILTVTLRACCSADVVGRAASTDSVRVMAAPMRKLDNPQAHATISQDRRTSDFCLSLGSAFVDDFLDLALLPLCIQKTAESKYGEPMSG